MNKIIITKMNGQILTAMSNGSRIVQMHLEEKDSQSVLGNISEKLKILQKILTLPLLT